MVTLTITIPDIDLKKSNEVIGILNNAHIDFAWKLVNK